MECSSLKISVSKDSDNRRNMTLFERDITLYWYFGHENISDVPPVENQKDVHAKGLPNRGSALT